VNTILFPSKDTGETNTYNVQFDDRLQVGETISSVAVTVLVYSGTDTDPSTIVSGSPTFSGSIVSFTITAGVIGVIYVVVVTVTSSLANVYVKEGFLAIVATNPY
jgi:hypothetical protein